MYLTFKKKMLLLSIFFFFLGCQITLTFLNVDCAKTISTSQKGLSEFNSVEYIVLILSGPNNENKRDAIRATWGKFSKNIVLSNGEKLYKWNNTNPSEFIRMYFVIATKGLTGLQNVKVQEENERSNDLLLLENFEDSYTNLSIKILHSLKWINNSFSKLKYVIKCDDDSFVRIDMIVMNLEAFAPKMNAQEIQQFVSYKNELTSYKGLYWGYFNGRAKVFLNGKWEEKEWFLCDNYLPYALGGGYIISQSIVDYIARNGDLLSHYISEDVSMGVWTAALDGINRVHDIRFDTQWTTRGCNNHMLVRHKQQPSDMFQMYKNLMQSKGENICETDSSLRKSYRYNWNVLPSQCCRV